MRRILVTGSSGFIGTNLVEHYLRSDDAAVLGVDRRPPRNSAHAPVWRHDDLSDARAVLALMREFKPTHLVHLAAVTDQNGRSMADYASNTDGLRRVLEAATQYGGLQRSVFASTRLVCEMGQLPVSDYDYFPPNFYGRSKVIGEQLVRACRDIGEWVIVRPTSIWGPWGEAPYRDFFLSLARGTYVHPGREEVRKHYGYVGNTVYQMDTLLTAPAASVHGRTFYLADPEPVEVRAFAAAIRRSMRLPPPRSVPVPLLHVLARSGDALGAVGITKLPISSTRLRNLRSDMLFDLEEMAAVVGPLPYSLQDGIDHTVAHLREQGDIAPARARSGAVPAPART